MDTSILDQTRARSDDESVLVTRDSTQPEAMLLPGSCIQGKYEVLGVLGHGGFAVVYDAEHIGLGRRVALKVLHVGEDTPLALLERFRREARISALVKHPNVLEVYDIGQLEDGSPFLVMERVNGENLSALIRRAPLSIAAALEVGRQLLLGLEAIAEAGIVHRDVKPDNIMLHEGADGTTTVKLVDFGISKHVSVEAHARLTCHGALVGTPQYMSPEQLRGEDVDARTDIYAAGAVLYESLSGRAPHQCDNFSELVVAVLNSDVPPLTELRPNCPPELSRIILTALSRSRAQRYASARALLEALEELACLFELPRGADAFLATDSLAFLQAAPARSSTPGQRKIWGFGWREAKLPLQVACVTLLAFSPRLLTHSSASGEPARSRAPSVAAARHSVVAMDPLTAQLISTAPTAPLAQAPQEMTSPTLPTGMGTPTVAPEASANTQVVSPKRSAVSKSAAKAARPVAVGSLPVVPAASAPAEAEPVLGAAQRAKWEQTMQEALSATVRGRLKAAKAAYSEATRLAPREAAGFRGLGLVAARLGESRDARSAWNRYLTLSPHASDAAAIAARIAALPN
ncbi:MAG: Serine/threonine protein kinase PrkC, regulation of stationary phase [Myxococcaceae bacterium]|nr:Serine/threonine protein kinase PrkC, regulation of stationary phase [Myxococcaceae bacterium]